MPGSGGISTSSLGKLKSVLDQIEIDQRASRKGASADLCWPGTLIGSSQPLPRLAASDVTSHDRSIHGLGQLRDYRIIHYRYLKGQVKSHNWSGDKLNHLSI